MTAEDKIESRIKVAKTKVFVTKTPESGAVVFNAHSDLIAMFEKSSRNRVYKPRLIIDTGRLPQYEPPLNIFQKAKQYGIVIQAKS